MSDGQPFASPHTGISMRGQDQDPRLRKLCIIADVVLVEGIAILLFHVTTRVRGANHDVAMYLDLGTRMLHGEVPYVDFVELNPPLIYYLSMGVSGLASVLRLDVHVTMNVLLLLLTLSIAFLQRWLTRGPSSALAGRLLAVATVWCSLGFNWGQREHLFVLLCAPMIASRALDVRTPRAAGLALGLLAAVGSCLKPFFLAIIVVGEVARSCHRRSVALDSMLAGWVLGSLFYAAHVLFWPPEMREAFFQVWVPFVSERYASGYDASWPILLRGSAIGLLLFAVAVLGAISFPSVRGRHVRTGPDPRPLAFMSLAAMANYYLQGKGFSYHLLPALFLCTWCVAVTVSVPIPSGQPARRFAFIVLWTTLAFFLSTRVLSARLLNQQTLEGGQLSAAFDVLHRSPGSALVVSSMVDASYPWLHRRGIAPVSRHPTAFAAALLPSGDPSALDWSVDRAVRDQLVADLQADLEREPDLLIIETSTPCRFCAPGRSFTRFLEEAGLLSVIDDHWMPVAEAAGHTLYVPRATIQSERGRVPEGQSH